MSLGKPNTGPTSPAPHEGPATAARPAQLALAVLSGLLLGLLLFRGYGTGTGTRPSRPVSVLTLDLNRASPAELAQVPGIGPGLAEQITRHRERQGGFRSVEELRQVKGIGPVTFEKVRVHFRVEPPGAPPGAPAPDELLLLDPMPTSPAAPSAASPAPAATPAPTLTRPPADRSAATRKLQPGDPPLNVNTATPEELQRLPGVGPVLARNIAAARAEGPLRSLADLDRVKGIGPKTLEKLRPFVTFE